MYSMDRAEGNGKGRSHKPTGRRAASLSLDPYKPSQIGEDPARVQLQGKASGLPTHRERERDQAHGQHDSKDRTGRPWGGRA